MDPDRLLAEARDEIARKSRAQIEQDTAWRWAARGVAAYEVAAARYSTYPQGRFSRWLVDTTTYLGEAIEHAALADNTGEVLRQVRVWVAQRVPPGAI